MSCFSDIYFWRQSLILVADGVHSIGTGFLLSYSAVLNPAILAKNSTIQATSDQASSISASYGISGVIGFCFVPILMQQLGRKTVHILINLLVSIGFLIFALANSIFHLYAAKIIQGLTICEVYVTVIILGEYSDPKRRGYFVGLKKVSVAVGSLMCHSMAFYWSWRQIAMFSTIPHILAIAMTFFWPESPAFLALNGRYEKCTESYTWLYGNSPKNKRDLEELLSAQVERRQQRNKFNMKLIMKKFLRKDFLKPFIIVSLMTMIIDACGRYYMLAYVVQIMTEITKDNSIALYCTIGADLLTIVALAISCFVIRCFKRRTLLFSTGIICVLLMFLVSVMTFVNSFTNMEQAMMWLTPCVILLNVFVVNIGVIPTSFAIIAEIFPLEHKGSGSCATGIVFTVLFALVMKFTPLMMERTGVHGTFGIYGFCVFIGFLLLYFILNETKDKTLQEIENEIKGNKPTALLDLNQRPLIGR